MRPVCGIIESPVVAPSVFNNDWARGRRCSRMAYTYYRHRRRGVRSPLFRKKQHVRGPAPCWSGSLRVNPLTRMYETLGFIMRSIHSTKARKILCKPYVTTLENRLKKLWAELYMFLSNYYIYFLLINKYSINKYINSKYMEELSKNMYKIDGKFLSQKIWVTT